ncbi:hypothetical protein BCR37DRAFT_108311 [Protomyces lactucae-debilis]|uniref:Thioredoxin domain-containing protein n=1 Tax=Protomyces lactucae-debilis TaxID=2754530 RepID=A0A1Y2F3U2_PROLT|nr:uncharacterized protein BCR37DRAFT_108311 [Protomyces lactucae-debilis]ORY78578.1 hypothetical protein BCR37DRAFT_108311 [Protomyces lactucae-debilis]
MLRRQAAALKTTSSIRLLSTGVRLPDIQLRKDSPGTLVSVPTPKKSIIIGIPAAFSPACSSIHIPGYLKRLKELAGKGVTALTVVSVNDAFVQGAYGKQMLQDYPETHGITIDFLADQDAAWTKAAELEFDASAILGGMRCRRFAAVLEDGVVRDVYVEADGTGVTTSAAEHVAKRL